MSEHKVFSHVENMTQMNQKTLLWHIISVIGMSFKSLLYIKDECVHESGRFYVDVTIDNNGTEKKRKKDTEWKRQRERVNSLMV